MKIGRILQPPRKDTETILISLDQLLKLIQNRFAANLRYLELPCDLITREVLQELANRFSIIIDTIFISLLVG